MGAEVFADEEDEDESSDSEAKATQETAAALTAGTSTTAAAVSTDIAEDELPPPVKKGDPLPRVFWEAHISPGGVPYYHNTVTGESRWTLPTGPLDVVVPPSAKPAERREPDGEVKGSADAADATAARASSSSSSSSASSSDSDGDGAAERPMGKVAAFRAMLRERGVGCFDRYEKWLPRLLSDPRFTAIPVLERKVLFQKEAKDLGQQQRKAAATSRLSACKAFGALLGSARERGLLKGARTATEALASLARQGLAKDERWQAAQARDRLRMITEVLKEDTSAREEDRAKAARCFRALIQEAVLVPAEAEDVEPPPFGEARRRLREDARWKAVEDPAERQRLYVVAADEARERWQQKRKRQAEDEDDLNAKRQRNRREDAQQEFHQHVLDHIKVLIDLDWPQAMVALRLLGEGRAGGAAELSEAEREMVFNEVKGDERQRRLELFKDVLRRRVADEAGAVAVAAAERSFGEAKKAAAVLLPGGEAFFQGLAEVDIKRAWEDWRRAQLMSAASALEVWLRGSEYVREAASDADALDGRGPAFEALCRRLANDERYQRMDLVPSERRRLITQRVREAAKELSAARMVPRGDDSDD